MVQQQRIITALIHLPLFYNPQEQALPQPIEEEKFIVTAEEIAKQFGGGLLHRYPETPPKGFWWSRNIVQRDDITLLEVDVPDSEENREWLTSYARNVLLHRFQQAAIYIKLVRPTETLEITDLKISEE